MKSYSTMMHYFCRSQQDSTSTDIFTINRDIHVNKVSKINKSPQYTKRKLNSSINKNKQNFSIHKTRLNSIYIHTCTYELKTLLDSILFILQTVVCFAGLDPGGCGENLQTSGNSYHWVTGLGTGWPSLIHVAAPFDITSPQHFCMVFIQLHTNHSRLLVFFIYETYMQAPVAIYITEHSYRSVYNGMVKCGIHVFIVFIMFMGRLCSRDPEYSAVVLIWGIVGARW